VREMSSSNLLWYTLRLLIIRPRIVALLCVCVWGCVCGCVCVCVCVLLHVYFSFHCKANVFLVWFQGVFVCLFLFWFCIYFFNRRTSITKTLFKTISYSTFSQISFNGLLVVLRATKTRITRPTITSWYTQRSFHILDGQCGKLFAL